MNDFGIVPAMNDDTQTVKSAFGEAVNEFFAFIESSIPGTAPFTGSVDERFAALLAMSKDRLTRALIIAVVKSRITFYETFLSAVDPQDAEDTVIEDSYRLMVYSIARFMVGGDCGWDTIKAHWIPHCFIKDFSTGVQAPTNKKRKGVSFVVTRCSARGKVLEENGSDALFVHSPVDTGIEGAKFVNYYDNLLEAFFTYWESRYSEMHRDSSRRKTITAMDVVSNYVFGVTMEFRKADRKGKFSMSKVSDLCEKLHETSMFDGTRCVRLVPGVESKVFTAVQGTSTVDIGEDRFAIVYPVTATWSIVVTAADHPVKQLREIANSHQESLVNRMRAREFSVYGKSLSDVLCEAA